MIVRGEYNTGERLPPMQIMAQNFQVSLSSMRESLRTLEMAGLLTVKHGRGVYVTNRLSLSDDSVSTMLATNHLKLKTVYEARMVLEIGALPLAVERATDARIAQLRELTDAIDITADARVLSRSDLDLHMALVEAAGNPLLTEMLKPLVRAIATDIRFLHSLTNVREEYVGWHRAIVEALEERNAVRCQEVMREHLTRGLEILTSITEERPEPAYA